MYELPVMSGSDYKNFNVVVSLCNSYYVTYCLLIGSLAVIQSVSTHLVTEAQGVTTRVMSVWMLLISSLCCRKSDCKKNVYFTCNCYYTLPTIIDKRLPKMAKFCNGMDGGKPYWMNGKCLKILTCAHTVFISWRRTWITWQEKQRGSFKKEQKWWLCSVHMHWSENE